MPWEEGKHPRGSSGQFGSGGGSHEEFPMHGSREERRQFLTRKQAPRSEINTTIPAKTREERRREITHPGRDEMGSNLPTIPASPSGGVPASSRERGMSVSDARRIIQRINDAWPMQAKTGEPPEKAPKMSATGAAPAPVKPVGDRRLPTRDVFSRRVRDAVRAGKPIPKVLQFGTAWLGTSGGSPTWQPYDARDAARRSFKRAMRDACSCGQSAGDAIAKAIGDAGVDGIIDLGETGGHGVPMSGWVKAPGPPADEDAADTKHFFKGSAADTFRRWIRRGATVADAVMWATKQQEPDEWWSARNGISAEGASVPKPDTKSGLAVDRIITGRLLSSRTSDYGVKGMKQGVHKQEEGVVGRVAPHPRRPDHLSLFHHPSGNLSNTFASGETHAQVAQHLAKAGFTLRPDHTVVRNSV